MSENSLVVSTMQADASDWILVVSRGCCPNCWVKLGLHIDDVCSRREPALTSSKTNYLLSAPAWSVGGVAASCPNFSTLISNGIADNADS